MANSSPLMIQPVTAQTMIVTAMGNVTMATLRTVACRRSPPYRPRCQLTAVTTRAAPAAAGTTS